MQTEQRPPIILLHGARHGAWCWQRVVEALEADGWSVTAITLPGHGYVVRRYLEQNTDVARGMLVASAPLKGVVMASLRFAGPAWRR